MVRLKLKRLDDTLPRMTTILRTCKAALEKANYEVEWEDSNKQDALIINSDRGSSPPGGD